MTRTKIKPGEATIQLTVSADGQTHTVNCRTSDVKGYAIWWITDWILGDSEEVGPPDEHEKDRRDFLDLSKKVQEVARRLLAALRSSS